MYAVVRTGGKQYRVEEGRSIKIERVAGEPGDTVELGEVLLMGNGDDVTVGAPLIEGARVVGTIAEQGRSKKIVVFRYKAKTRQRKKTGHRQHFTRVLVSDILTKGQEPKPKPERAPRAVAAAPDTAVAEPPAEAPAEPKPKTRRAKPGTPEAIREIYAEAAAEAEEAEKPKRGRKKSDADAPKAENEPKDEKPKRSRKKTEE